MAHNLTRTETRQAALGEALAAAPPLRELADIARTALDEGCTENEVRTRVKAHAERSGFVTWKFLLPSLNREAMRLPFPKLLHALASHYAKQHRYGKVRDFVEAMSAKLGFDDWVVDSAMSLATTGQAIPVIERLTGGVHVQEMTFPDGSISQVVMLTAGPVSDFEELAEEFLSTCARVYPAASWERPRHELRDARRFAAFHTGSTDADIAWRELEEKYPHEIVNQNPKFDAEHRRLTVSIKQARHRFDARVTEILDIASPDSGTA